MNQANPNPVDGPAAISARLSTAHNQHPNNNTDLLQHDPPPLLCDWAGGWESRSIVWARYSRDLLRALVAAAAV